jgi:chromosome condensin MukBEF ATPase and DNA-binding subunit MukB
VKDAVESIGYKLKHSMLRRVLSDVELDARKQHLDSNVAQDKFLNRLIEDTQQKIVNAYNAEDDTDQIEKLEKRLDDLQGRRNTLVEGIAKMRANAKNLLPDATTAAIGAERRTWTAIADGGAEQPDGQKSNAAAAGADGAAAPPTPAPATPAPDAAGPAGE